MIVNKYKSRILNMIIITMIIIINNIIYIKYFYDFNIVLCKTDVFVVIFLILSFITIILLFHNIIHRSKVEYKDKMNKMILYNIKSIVHDFKSPIKTLNGLIFLLSNKLKNNNDNSIQEYSKKITTLLEYFNEIINSNLRVFLNHSRMENTKIELYDVINMTTNLIHYNLKDIDIILDDSLKDKFIYTDTYILIRIIQNILTNIQHHNKTLEYIKIYYKNSNGHNIIFENNCPEARNIKRHIRRNYKKSIYGLGLTIIRELLYKINGKITFSTIKNIKNQTIINFKNLK